MKKILAIYGPTATGKTSLATELAKKFNGEIISADSRQVYKGLDIGSGKASFDSDVQKHQGYWIVDGVKIHGFDLVEPPGYEPGSRKVSSSLEPGSGSETFTAFDFLKFVHTTLIRIGEVKKLPIIVGGTGFYIKALIDGIDSAGIPKDQKLRQKLEKLSVDELYQKLLSLAPNRGKTMNGSDRANPRRLIRAIEIAKASLTPGVRSPRFAREAGKIASMHTPGVSLIIGLTAPNEYLYKRADKWLETRLQKGMVEEVDKLIKSGVDPTWLDNLGLEYRWMTRYILGKITKNQAIERLRGDIHDFIRRQKTWFKKFQNTCPPITHHEPSTDSSEKASGKFWRVELFDITSANWHSQLEKAAEDWYNQIT